METKLTSAPLRYAFAVIVVFATIGMRLLLLPWTGAGAPFVLFFGAVVISGFLWGVGPGLVAGFLAAPVAAFLFIYQANYTAAEAIAQSIIFLIEVSIVCFLADRFAKAKRQSEHNERTARQAEALIKKWQRIFDKADWGIVVANPQTDLLEMANQGFASMLGCDVNDLIGKPLFDVFTPEARIRLKGTLQSSHESGRHGFEAMLARMDGNTLPVMVDISAVKDERGEILYRAVNIRDLTEIHQSRLQEAAARARVEAANEALQRSEAELREAQRLAHVGNWNWDARTDTVRWSEEIYRIYGLDPTKPAPSFYGEHSSLFTPESMSRLSPAVEKTLSDGTPYEMDLQVMRPDGSMRWISARGEAIRDASGIIRGLYGTVVDITHLKQLQRMREEWTSVIAHDLRQPIGVISMGADLLLKVYAGEMSERERRITERIRSATQGLVRMVDDLLDLSRIEAERLYLDRKWIDPRIAVREAVERLSEVDKGVRVNVREGEDLLPVYADPIRLEQVLANLLSNAVKYGDPNSEILVRLNRSGNDTEISISNHGVGIAPDELPRLFDRFYRTTTSRRSDVPGLGLGLYISKGLVEAHSGRIWAESIPGDTTTFHVMLPLRVDSTESNA